MANKIHISIPQPCHENWDNMTPADKGRFCNSCQKNVIDFTKASDKEIITAFQQNENLCGRFLNSQLNRDLVKPKEKSTIWLATTTVLISLIGINEAVAQQKAPTEQTDRKVVGKPAAPKTKITIIGQVLDNEQNPVPDVTITVKGRDIIFHTDEKGKFNIQIERNDTLLFSKDHYFPGLDQYTFDSDRGHFTVLMQTVTVKKTTNHQGTLLTVMGGPMVGQKIEARKRTFFGRIFHSIGNWFK